MNPEDPELKLFILYVHLTAINILKLVFNFCVINQYFNI